MHPSRLGNAAAQISVPHALHADNCAVFALLEFNPSCASPHTYWLCNDEAWSLQRYLHPCFCFLIPPSALFYALPSFTCCLLTYICLPPPSAVRVHHGELASSFTGLLHQVCTTLWALKALLAAALTEMNIVYLCNAQQVTQHIHILCALGRISHFIHHSQLAAAISQSQSLSINT